MPGIVPPATLLTQTAVVDVNKSQFSFSDLQNLWIQAGGNPAKAKIAAAVAMAESRGMRMAQNHNSDGSVDRGPWQINSIHGAMSTFDARGNARAAVAISKNGTDWSPWVTFKNGAFRQFLHGASVPAATIASGGDVPGVTSLQVPGGAGLPNLNPLSGVTDFLNKLGVIFQLDWWKRVGLIFLGLAALIGGAIYAAKEFMPKTLPIPV